MALISFWAKPRRRGVPLNSTLAIAKHMQSSESIVAVMVHVAEVDAAIAWYRQAFPQAVLSRDEASDFEFLSIGGVQLELVPADEKVSSGPSGSVVYWKVQDFEKALARLKGIGAKVYRGPMRIDVGYSMCQVQDPWGNCIGLRGPSSVL